jgi:ubiquinone/menaquinone biosynthesis C-methylase UbiE
MMGHARVNAVSHISRSARPRRAQAGSARFFLLPIALCLGVALAYWLLIVGELTYLGRRAVRFLYQRGAHMYDAVREQVVASDEAALLPLLAAPLAAVRQPRVLDVATGTGRVPLLLARQPWFDGLVQGVDIAPAMLREAEAKLRAHRLLGRVALREGEAGALPWADGSFHLATCLEALEFFPRPRAALRELARVLRPGGTLVVSKYPDGWARALPGKGLTSHAITSLLGRLGLRDVRVIPWQPGHYELVIATKGLSAEN